MHTPRCFPLVRNAPTYFMPRSQKIVAATHSEVFNDAKMRVARGQVLCVCGVGNTQADWWNTTCSLRFTTAEGDVLIAAAQHGAPTQFMFESDIIKVEVRNRQDCALWTFDPSILEQPR